MGSISGIVPGLFVSRDFIDFLGENVSVASAENFELRFFLTLPYNKTKVTGKLVRDNPLRNYNWQNKTILIAEDEETNYLYLKTALSKTSAVVIRAKNGKEAVDAVKANPEIDIVLMDIKMPEMNGIEATRIIKSIAKNMVVIAQTAFALEEDWATYMKAGCNDYLVKPIKRDKLLQTVARYL